MIETPCNRIAHLLKEGPSLRKRATSYRPATTATDRSHWRGGLMLLALCFLANLLDLLTRLDRIDPISLREAVLIALQSGVCVILGTGGMIVVYSRGRLSAEAEAGAERDRPGTGSDKRSLT